ncbi:esterase SG1-like [Belonocnema kinseyi]|uniref:esterase SG1-like n=1 Tax=Belonocnema kinseyi TaxID=2817044 RepID=UPI00143D6754|nr:esterase SG1-like [Belonocnema kinseyi]
MSARFVVALFMLNFVKTFSSNNDPLVKIPQGLLKGTHLETRNGRKISVFLGIPYAKPPIGKLRFRSPVPAEKWKGLRLAHTEGNMCPQLKSKNLLGDENCLYLNIYTPILEFNSTLINSKKNLLPVMVWIHGGGFKTGSGSFTVYGPSYILDKDVILVSINYRLGVLGFFTTGDLLVPGNMGLKDQVLALKWVQENIHFFGGDPDKVTIFGQSSAGACVNLHTISDASKGNVIQDYFTNILSKVVLHFLDGHIEREVNLNLT